MPGEGRKGELQYAAYRFFNGSDDKHRGRRRRTNATSCAGTATGSLMSAVAVIARLAGLLHDNGIVLVRFLMRGCVHHFGHRHILRLDTAVFQGMMAHTAFDPRYSRNALHGQGYDEQAQEK